MTENDKEILLYRILSGYTIFFVNGQRYKLVSPNKSIKYKACLLYDNIINEEKYQEWLREDNAINIMIGLGIWNINTNKSIQDLENKIDDLKVELFKSAMNTKAQNMIRNRLKNLKMQLNKILLTKHNFISNTLEGYANSLKNEYIICNTLYDNTNKLVFNYNQRVSSNSSYSNFNTIVNEIDSMSISTEQFRILARSGLWKSYWNIHKHGTIFDKSIKDWTDEQRALVNINRMYDNIYEHPECPDDKVFEDDDMLDGWMIIQRRKADKDKKQKSFDENNPTLKKSGEVFLFASNKEEISDILSMNSDESLQNMNEKIRTIKEKGSVQDGELPDVQRELRRQINEFNKQMKG